MKLDARIIVAAVLLVFSWKGSTLDLSWPPQGERAIAIPAPDPVLREWATALKPILPKMLPQDRKYLSHLYDAMAFILMRDFSRETPIVASTSDLVNFHAGTLRLAIDKANVGKYPGLDAAIDEVFFTAIGAEQRQLSEDDQAKAVAACNVLSWTFAVNRDE